MNRGRGLFTAGAILLASVALAGLMVWLKPEPEYKPSPPRVPLVITVPVVVGADVIRVYGAGTVRPRAEITVAAEIKGKVSWVDPAFQTGGRVREGQILFRIDDADYRNRVKQSRANVAAQKVVLLQVDEEARIARSEYAKFKRRQAESASQAKTSPLTLQRPQLEAARAALVRDSALLADAELALSRTKVRAPFDGVVQAESVDVGQFVDAGQSVGRLYAADAVEVVVPLADADAALIPGLWDLEAGDGDKRVAARVMAEYGDGSYEWAGYVDRAEASLDTQTRTINVIVRVPDPFAAGVRVGADNGPDAGPGAASNFSGPPLLVGKFVEVHMQGSAPGRYFRVPPPALRTGHKVWAIRDKTVTIVPVRVLQRSDDDVFVTGAFEAGQPVVVGGIRIATEGMAVRITPGGGHEPG